MTISEKQPLDNLFIRHIKNKNVNSKQQINNNRDKIIEKEDNHNGLEVKNQALMLFKEKNFEAAKNQFKLALQFLMVGSKNYSSVKEQYKQDVLDVFHHLVQCSLMASEWKDARDYCTNILDIDTKNIKALQQRATANKHLDDIDESILDLERALELDPSNKSIKQSLKNYKKKNNST
ncbi:hypothetical protein DICPUDRAFT_29500 [Dictyostelium purpureum]|uniref:Uncharacterized protein n=1 Tax=Dictyostelium purpureum TaxID=5786 RepID=F0ZDM4_DICPU|nr:uncharacterized protein DICPUDRAFT_29500 [Dictyostelium purpureum]EGC37939.1 hypothetical protein DICPUDRAFT_29500 [Dictyostelium purpureum]|eukprot:XP_003285510.1 hypothetical protein DICPUDRAFT_29500 [Dictyostelium purpureum]